MVDLGVTEADFHTKWYLTGRKNELLKELSETLSDVEMYKTTRELRKVMQELRTDKASNKSRKNQLLEELSKANNDAKAYELARELRDII